MDFDVRGPTRTTEPRTRRQSGYRTLPDAVCGFASNLMVPQSEIRPPVATRAVTISDSRFSPLETHRFTEAARSLPTPAIWSSLAGGEA